MVLYHSELRTWMDQHKASKGNVPQTSEALTSGWVSHMTLSENVVKFDLACRRIVNVDVNGRRLWKVGDLVRDWRVRW